MPPSTRCAAFSILAATVMWVGAGSINSDLQQLLHAPIQTTVTENGRIFVDADGLSTAGQHPVQATVPLFEGILFSSLIQHVFYDTRYNEGTAMMMEHFVPEGSACNPPDIYHATALWGPAFAGGIACNQSVSRAYFANGYLEEVHSSNAQINAIIAGGSICLGASSRDGHGDVRGAPTPPPSWTGLDTALAEFNATPEGDCGDAEIWKRRCRFFISAARIESQ